MARIKHNPSDKPAHYIRQWRKHRGLNQERLAYRLKITQGHLSQIENFKRDYNQHLLEAIADALSCQPADLILGDPMQDPTIWSIWCKVPEIERPKVLQIIELFAIE